MDESQRQKQEGTKLATCPFHFTSVHFHCSSPLGFHKGCAVPGAVNPVFVPLSLALPSPLHQSLAPIAHLVAPVSCLYDVPALAPPPGPSSGPSTLPPTRRTMMTPLADPMWDHSNPPCLRELKPLL